MEIFLFKNYATGIKSLLNIVVSLPCTIGALGNFKILLSTKPLGQFYK